MMERAIGILGGTFDPPHIGHLVLGECARLEFGLERVLFMPAGDPYRKTTPGEGAKERTVSPAEDRVAMVRLATGGNPAFEVDDRETRRAGATYTIDTLESLQAEPGNEDTELVLILGSDALADMPYWKQPERIFERALVVIAQKGPPPRTPAPPGEIAIPPQLLSLLRGRWSARAGRLVQFEHLPQTLPLVQTMPGLPISSTVIRQRVADGKPVRYLVPDGVEQYIRDHGLYAGGHAAALLEAGFQ